ncbi:hypothetical protein COW36_14560 [bacterium (Candidatus Blackallbacteria) CG17_big_fil_post_rev_8_21_14_2_50_48_46]|uniref:SLH domain-containing protein n=1 Tax=bacterium (Candidatus Blackallbacteria) CG17_big_fil_post_rev_8_21_14_2_50_48_46 TaxID=2014261 RepID=A0A2M7G2A4_9BACT|nr:MAG: hypothetical protein COW64_11990 [bacterium (Candidatus Blackallbacteria) CG18_big_fil_WC_8_21_14_2_50_49_26]PIW15937.1 MAG: hypothetical protein COW36_14560 [bacterium (Candidatus Blackallbacteria) CG17_big_fil_post_rev_8_21_14_2_50_48_46]PIW50349.1 MAG: hypothetical protein COW20_02275 [bacterium (Candidatus Blackallbacteria) CG13_big_fil_rev_8_21_14_2_50_49_14]
MKLKQTAMLALAATFTVSGLTVFTAPAKAEVTFESMLMENGGDLDRTHWAANAIQELVDKYKVMSGFPDKKFRGSKTLSRYEMAAALYQVMKYVDSSIASIKPEVTKADLAKYATKDDLKQIAALQMEFKKELDMLKEGHMELAKRVDMLERVKVHGKVEVRYRDRVSVTDGTDTASPLFGAGNSNATKVVGTDLAVSDRPATDDKTTYKNNNGQAERAAGMPKQFNSPMSPNVTVDDLVPFRVRSNLSVSAMLTDGLMAHTSFDMFELGSAGGTAVNNGGHDVNEGSANGGAFVFRKAYLAAGMLDDKDMGASFKVGLMNFSKDLNTGSALTNHFGNNNWTGRGYGLVGWGSADIAASNNSVTDYRNSISRYWAGGLNASMVDPDSKNYNQATSPAASFNAGWGWGKFFVGANYGSVQTDRAAAAAGNLNSGAAVNGADAAFKVQNNDSALYAGAVLQGLDRKTQANGTRLTANNLALPSQYGDGYMVAGLDLNFFKESFPVRLNLSAMSFLNDNMLDFSNPSRKEVSGVLDLGWSKNFGMTVGVNKSFIGYDRHSVGMFFNDLGGSGFDIQLGANLATRGIFAVSDIAAANAGVALGIPFLNMGKGKDNIKLILAARQSLGDNLGGSTDAGAPNQMFKDSGLTVSLPYMNVGGSPLNIRAEYSMLLADALWQFRPVAHDVSVVTSYMF